MDYIRNTFLLDELERLQTFMENNQDTVISFEEKIKDWPRTEVLSLLSQYIRIVDPAPLKRDGTPYIPNPPQKEFTPQPNIKVGQEVLYVAALCTQHVHGAEPIRAKVMHINPDGSLDVILLPEEKFHEEPRFYVTYSTKKVADSDYPYWKEL